jgi:hypothetical protein
LSGRPDANAERVPSSSQRQPSFLVHGHRHWGPGSRTAPPCLQSGPPGSLPCLVPCLSRHPRTGRNLCMCRDCHEPRSTSGNSSTALCIRNLIHHRTEHHDKSPWLRVQFTWPLYHHMLPQPSHRCPHGSLTASLVAPLPDPQDSTRNPCPSPPQRHSLHQISLNSTRSPFILHHLQRKSHIHSTRTDILPDLHRTLSTTTAPYSTFATIRAVPIPHHMP